MRADQFVAMVAACWLTPQLVRADETPRCTTMATCARLAAKTPASFSLTLESLLSDLPASSLVDGLSWKHARPAVTQLGQGRLWQALATATGHTTESARKLLIFIESHPDAPWKEEWVDALASDPPGRLVLGEFIDAHFDDPLGQLAALAYVVQLGSVFDAKERKVPADADEQARVQRCKAHIWQKYLREKATEPRRTRTVEDVLFGNDFSSTVLSSVVFREEIEASLRADIAAKRPPDAGEFDAFVESKSGDPEFARLLLTWAEAPEDELRRLATGGLSSFLSSTRFTEEERHRVRRVLMKRVEDAPEQDQHDRMYMLMEIGPFVAGATDVEARHLLEMTRTQDDEYAQSLMLANLSEPLPELRPQLLARIFDRDLDTAEKFINTIRSAHCPGLRTEVSRWVLGLSPEQLKDEAAQEQLIVVASALDTSTGDRWRHPVRLPESRRSRIDHWAWRCGGGNGTEQGRMETARRDLKAFGLPPPKPGKPQKANSSPTPKADWNRIPASPPLTEKEKERRWQDFVVALKEFETRFASDVVKR